MPVYATHLMLVSLSVRDMPLGYAPPRGPRMDFTLHYSQREAFQPQTFFYSHLGPKWTFDWLSYVEDDPTNPSALVRLAGRGGGRQTYQGLTATATESQPEPLTRAILVRTSSSPIRYERRLADGSVEIFAQPDGAMVSPRRVFMTEWRDPAGNAVALTYDAQLRLVAATDAIGQVTTLAYTDAADTRRITRVTDPFGRYASFSYDAAGRLQQITDVIGMQSSFVYDSGDFIAAMTTPYGTTRFAKGDNGKDRWLDIVDPLGGRERVEFRAVSPLTASEPAATVPSGAGLAFTNTYLQYRNTFFWDKRAMVLAPGDLASAHLFHWLHTSGPMNQTSGTLESERKALERRVWYLYAGQSVAYVEGTSHQPSVVARVLDDGSSQIWRRNFNSRDRMVSETDPLGRRTDFGYASNDIDRTEIRQTTGSLNDLLVSYGSFNPQHLPQLVTDGAGQSATVTYNAQGQILTVTNARNETTTYVYDSSGYLQTVTEAASGATTTYTHDSYGRVRTTTRSDGYSWTIDYDALDRPVRVTYPDGSYRENLYDRLDIVGVRDRLGRWTRHFYDSQRRLTAIRDALGRTTTLRWCVCSALDEFIDGTGQRTTWERDLRGRVTREVRADQTSAATYVYETSTSRLLSVTDAKLQVTTYAYNLDDTLQQVTFTNTSIATPSVSFTYDPSYRRLASMVDGTGATTYTYRLPGQSGAGRLATIDGPLTNDTSVYTYDELGRVIGHALNGVGTSYTFDSLGRIDEETNPLGTFTYDYVGATPRLASVSYPNGQITEYSYFDNAGDTRLKTIHNKRPGGTLSKLDYTYDAVGNVLTWQQQADAAAAVRWSYRYDAADQLLGAVESTTDVTPVTLKRLAYVYDVAGNRTSAQNDDSVSESTFNSLNRLTQTQPGGAIRFAGTLSEPASVKIQGREAQVDATNAFNGTSTISTGTSVVTLQATDASGNVGVANYEVDALGTPTSLTFDANGNLTSDGLRTFEWNGRNELVAVAMGTLRSEFTYDGLRRRVREVEKDNGVVQTDTHLLWCETKQCEERGADGVTVTRRLFTYGEQTGTNSRFFTTDHLGSVREVTDTSVTLLARYSYDPWGKRAVTAGTDVTRTGFSGHQLQVRADVWLTRYRAYDGNRGRWLSEDPLGLPGGVNLYGYVLNRPLTHIDPDGLGPGGAGVGGAIGGIAGGIIGGIMGAGGGAAAGTVALPGGGTIGGGIVGAIEGAATGGAVGTAAGMIVGNAVEEAANAIHDAMMSKGGKQNTRSDEFRDLSDDEVSRRARDNSRNAEDRRKYQKEEKARGLRNKQKRCGK